MILGYFFATSSLLLHYSFTTPSLLLHFFCLLLLCSLVRLLINSRLVGINYDNTSNRSSLRADGDAWWWRGCLRTRFCQRGIHKKSVNSLDVVPATEALALPFTIETTTRSPRRYNKRRHKPIRILYPEDIHRCGCLMVKVKLARFL